MRHFIGRLVICLVWPLSLAIGCGGEGDGDDQDRAATAEQGEEDSTFDPSRCTRIDDEFDGVWADSLTVANAAGTCTASITNIKMGRPDTAERATVTADVEPTRITYPVNVRVGSAFAVAGHGNTIATFQDLKFSATSYQNGKTIPPQATLTYNEPGKTEHQLVLATVGEPVTVRANLCNIVITLQTPLKDSMATNAGAAIKLQIEQQMIASNARVALSQRFTHLDSMRNGPCTLTYFARPSEMDTKLKGFRYAAWFCMGEPQE